VCAGFPIKPRWANEFYETLKTTYDNQAYSKCLVKYVKNFGVPKGLDRNKVAEIISERGDA
jgi:hypothetical protein